MKKIIKGEKNFLFTKEIRFVEVPQYEELKPENVIDFCGLK